MNESRRVLGDYFELVRGTTYKSAFIGLPGPVLLGLGTIGRDGGFRDDSLRTYGGESPERLLVRPGELYLSLKDVTQSGDLLGSVARVPKHVSVGRLTQDTVRLDARTGDAPMAFLYWLLRTPEYRGYCRSRATGTTNLGLSRDDFLSFGVPVPTDEQQATCRALDALDEKIELNRRMSQTLEAIAQAIFKSWFVHFEPVRAKASGDSDEAIQARLSIDDQTLAMFPSTLDESELGLVPSGWSIEPISSLAEIAGGSTPGTKESAFWEGGIHYWATPKDLSPLQTPVLLRTERCVTHQGLGQISSGLLPPGTVLLSSRAPIGYRAIAEVPVAINQGFIALKPAEGVPSLFLLRWLESAHQEIVSRANGSTFLEISKSAFRAIKLVVPPRPLLTAYARACEPIYRRVVANERESLALVELRNSLLPELLSGNLPVDVEELPP